MRTHFIRELTSLCVFILPAYIIASLFSPEATAQQRCLQLAWSTYNAGQYQATIEHTNVCIQRFSEPARHIQCATQEGDWVPPIGAPVDEAEQKRTFELGLLNDVATSYFLRGMSAELLWDRNKADSSLKSMALESYRSVCELYPYGRAWDPQGWFWSPCQSSCYESQLLEPNPPYCMNEASPIACE